MNNNQDRIQCLLGNKQFIAYMAQNEAAEKDRLFCRHGLDHGLAVAEVAVAMAQAHKQPIKYDVVYAAGLLHDIGRWREYAAKEDHALVGSVLAVEILRDCGYNREEEQTVIMAIKHHREEQKEGQDLSEVLYRSDKLVRPCSSCQAKNLCKHFMVQDEGDSHG